ncbi:MAG TPA: hypothetical protein VLE43_04735, partial [Candidatus Saccharimonadia bacterium]|nr:hypothetical protein [Candidatus Saccharimonadia bacterium]
MRIPAIALLLSLVGTVLSAQTAPPAAATAPTPAPATPVISPEKTARDGQVWGALVYGTSKATEGKADAASPPEFPNLQKRLGKAFPYKHFEILGQH